MASRDEKARTIDEFASPAHATRAFLIDFKDITERASGPSKGFGFVEFTSADEARPQVTKLRKQAGQKGKSTAGYVVVKDALALIAFADSPGKFQKAYERELLVFKLLTILKSILQQRIAMQEQMRQLIETMTPRIEVPLPPQVLQARRNAVAREALLSEFGAMTSAQVGENAGSKSPNRAALAHRWKSDGRIFAVPHRGVNYFPGFQFTASGQPVAVIADVIRILGDRYAPWEFALWFAHRSGWLDGRRPVDLLESFPASVVSAAEHEAEGRVF